MTTDLGAFMPQADYEHFTATDEFDLTPFVLGARRAVAGKRNHAGAPGDPLFQSELVRFLQTAR